MQEIKRTVKYYVTKAHKVKNVEGNVQAEPLETLETTKKLSKVALEKHFKALIEENESVLIEPTSEITKAFTMDLDNFIKHSKECQLV
jgi:hypothetical protein